MEKKRVANNGIAPKYYVERSHEGIIDRDVFLRVQVEISRRENILDGGKKRIYSSKCALSSIVFCGHCGDIFRRIKWNNRECKSTVWRCVSRVLKKTSGIDCPARTIREKDLQAAVLTAINDTFNKKDEIIPTLMKIIQDVIDENSQESKEQLDIKIRELEIKLLEAGNE